MDCDYTLAFGPGFNTTNSSHEYNATAVGDDYYYYYYGEIDELDSGYAAMMYIISDIAPLILIICVVIGNVLIIATLLNNKNSRFSTTTLFIALAISDLISGCMSFIGYWVAIRITDAYSDLECKLDVLFRSTAIYCSAFILAVITLERTISVSSPHKVILLCRPQIVKRLLVVIGVTCMAFNIFAAYNFGAMRVGSWMVCDITSQRFQFYFMFIYPWIDACLSFILPGIVIFTGSMVIIITLYRRSKKHDTPSTQLRSITITLINTNVAFLLTKLPFHIWSIHYMILQSMGNCLDIPMAYVNFWNSLFVVFDETNHAINFFIYFLSGSQFRNGVKTLLAEWFGACRFHFRKY